MTREENKLFTQVFFLISDKKMTAVQIRQIVEKAITQGYLDWSGNEDS